MAQAEWDDLSASNTFRSIPSSIQGKWFATTLGDALVWGQSFPFAIARSTHVVAIEIDDQLVFTAFHIERLDGIGKAYYFEVADLIGTKFRLVNS